MNASNENNSLEDEVGSGSPVVLKVTARGAVLKYTHILFIKNNIKILILFNIK